MQIEVNHKIWRNKKSLGRNKVTKEEEIGRLYKILVGMHKIQNNLLIYYEEGRNYKTYSQLHTYMS